MDSEYNQEDHCDQESSYGKEGGYDQDGDYGKAAMEALIRSEQEKTQQLIRANEQIEKQLNEIQLYKQQLEEENLYLLREINGAYDFRELIGSAPAMQKIFDLITKVAPGRSTVLILGETGTGKELIGRAIHHGSPRKDQLMVKVNCATLPASLIESELFGHEKGSFTGATDRKLGKFELANNGTLFLDEIGEMPPDLQVKLLRVLQEREIERIGGKSRSAWMSVSSPPPTVLWKKKWRREGSGAICITG